MRTCLLSAGISLCLLAPAQRSLLIRGFAQVPEDSRENCYVTLMTTCGDTLAAENLSEGCFRFRVPRDAGYVLRFEQPASVTKEVVVSAADLPRVARIGVLRRIEFDVVMEAGDPAEHWRYAEPVGFSSLKGGRTMRVFYDPVVEAQVEVW